MSSNLLDNHSFEDSTVSLAPWTKSGTVTVEVEPNAFEGDNVAELSISSSGDVSILSQLVRVNTNLTHLHLVYAIRPDPDESLCINGRFTARIQWLGSANAGLPVLGEDILETIEPGALDEDEWQTRAPVSPTKPSGTVWARLRFVLGAPDSTNVGDVQVDNVFLTGEAP